jgi:hypothetical protein
MTVYCKKAFNEHINTIFYRSLPGSHNWKIFEEIIWRLLMCNYPADEDDLERIMTIYYRESFNNGKEFFVKNYEEFALPLLITIHQLQEKYRVFTSPDFGPNRLGFKTWLKFLWKYKINPSYLTVKWMSSAFIYEITSELDKIVEEFKRTEKETISDFDLSSKKYN